MKVSPANEPDARKRQDSLSLLDNGEQVHNPFLRQDLPPETRDIGLAEARYLTPEIFSSRSEIAGQIRHRASLNESTWILAGWEELDRTRISLRKQADRFEFCGMRYALTRCLNCDSVFVGRQRCDLRICDACLQEVRGRIEEAAVGHGKLPRSDQVTEAHVPHLDCQIASSLPSFSFRCKATFQMRS